MNGVSGTVLEALARARQRDEAERGDLFDLARDAYPATQERQRPHQAARPAQRLLILAKVRTAPAGASRPSPSLPLLATRPDVASTNAAAAPMAVPLPVADTGSHGAADLACPREQQCGSRLASCPAPAPRLSERCPSAHGARPATRLP